MLALAATVGAVQAKRSFFGGSDLTYPLAHPSTRPRLCDLSSEDKLVAIAPPCPAKPAPVAAPQPVSRLLRKRRAAAIEQPLALPATTSNGTDTIDPLGLAAVRPLDQGLLHGVVLRPHVHSARLQELAAHELRVETSRGSGMIHSQFFTVADAMRPTHPWQGQAMNPQIRALLVDWLMEVSHDYSLSPYTLFLGINYLDRFLSAATVERAGVQAAGAACLWIASKFEEQVPPTLSDFVYVGEATFTAPRLVHLEGLILHQLSFQLSVPTILHFLNEYVGMLRIENTVFTNIAKLFAELSLLDFPLSVQYCPSSVAAAAVYMALNIFKRVEADQHAQRLAALSAYKAQDPDLLACCRRFAEMIPSLKKNASSRMPYRTLKLKYDNPERCEAWQLVLGAELCTPE